MADNATAIAMPPGQAPLIHLEFQYRQVDTVLAVAYGGACFFSFWAFLVHRQSSSPQIATLGFYLLMGLAALIRVAWFSSPYGVLSVTMEPPRISMGDEGWSQFLASEAADMLGSYCFYSIFVLTVVFWADMLRRLFSHDHARTHPMRLFFVILGTVLAVQALGFAIFMAKKADSYWLLMYDDIEILVLSVASLVAMTVYSYRMTTILRAFLEVSQVDTTDRITAVNWATSICSVFLVFNAFFVTYSITSLAAMHRVDMLLDPKMWWVFVVSKHLLEVLSIYLLLYSLWGKSNEDAQRHNGYEPISESLSDEEAQIPNGSTGSPKRL